MQLLGRQWHIPQVVTLGLCIVAAGIAPSLAYGSYVTREYGRPSVTILGAGRELSVLVTDGPARLLIANGDNASQFGNALSIARPFGHSRIDVLLLIGTADDVTFLSRARNAADARHIDLIGPSTVAGSLGLPVEALLTSPRRYQLSAETIVTVEVAESSNEESGAVLSWQITIEHRQVRLVILPDGDVASHFPHQGVATALIVGGNDPISTLDVIQPFVVIRSRSADDERLREEIVTSLNRPVWIYRVFDGEAKSFVFTNRGLSLPSGGNLVEPASPLATS